MNKIIFITGASSGLGKMTAKLFAEKEWTVIATMRNPSKENELSQIPNIHLLQLDINDSDQISRVAKEAEDIGPVDVLFNNAGYVFAAPLEATTDEQMVAQFNTNVFGTMRLTRAFLPYLRKRKSGLILTTTSLGAYIPDPFMSSYAASKAALETWSIAMSYELKNLNIYIKTIIPGFMRTNFINNAQIALNDTYKKDWTQVMEFYSNADVASMGDLPLDIAQVVYQAATDEKKQLHYFAGNDAVRRSNELHLQGIDAIIKTRTSMFLG